MNYNTLAVVRFKAKDRHIVTKISLDMILHLHLHLEEVTLPPWESTCLNDHSEIIEINKFNLIA